KNHVQSHYFGLLDGQLFNQSPVNLARPIEPISITKRTRLMVGFDKRDARVINVNKREVRSCLRRKSKSLARAPIVRDFFESFEEVKIQHTQDTEGDDYPDRDQSGSQLDRLELHCCELNKKTRATQGCSGFQIWVLRSVVPAAF